MANHIAFVVDWTIAFAQYAFNVLGFLPAWTIDFLRFDASRLTKEKTFRIAIPLAISALRYLYDVIRCLGRGGSYLILQSRSESTS